MARYFFKCFYIQSIVTELCFKSLKTIGKVHLLITKYQALFAGFKLPAYQNQASPVSVGSHRQYSNLMLRKSWPNSKGGVSAIRGYSPPSQSNWLLSLSESCLLCLWKAYRSLCIDSSEEFVYKNIPCNYYMQFTTLCICIYPCVLLQLCCWYTQKSHEMAIIFNTYHARGNQSVVNKSLQAPIFHEVVNHVSLVLKDQKENKSLGTTIREGPGELSSPGRCSGTRTACH